MRLPPDHAVTVRLAFAPDDVVVVGRLLWRRGRVWLEFAAGFLAAPLPISPFHLTPTPS